MKKLILLLLIGISIPVVAQTSKAATAPVPNAAANAAVSKSAAPEISQADTIKLLQIQLQFGNLSQQMQKLQADGKALGDQYSTLAASLCKSIDGKQYTVEMGVTPACKEVPAPAKK